ncbi:MAG: rod shape-determining protein MreD [Anaerovoracaceae bacterium]
MKYRYSIPLFIFAFLFQSTIMNQLKIFGVGPNLILCLVILLSFLYEENQGLVLGVIFGIIQDLSFGQIIGPSAMAYFVVGFAIKYLRIIFYRDNVLSVFLTTVVGTGLFTIVNWVINTIFLGTYALMYVAKMMPILMGYHFMFMVLFYLIRGRRASYSNYNRY